MKAKLVVLGAIVFTVAVAVAALFATGILPPSDTSAAETTAPSTTTPSDTPQSTPAPPPPLSRALIATSASGNVVIAHTSDCGSGIAPSVRTVSADGETVAMPDPPAEIVRLEVAELGSYMVIGANAECQVDTYSSDDGATWTPSGSPPANWWYLPPGGLSTSLETGAGQVGVGCKVVSISVVQVSKAYAACEDGTIRATTDRGLSWTSLGAVQWLVAIAFVDAPNGYALAATADCPSAVLATEDGGATWTQISCIDGLKPQALDADGSDVVALVSDKLWRSADGGVSWSA